LVHDDVYLVQLKQPSDELDNMAIPTFNDQLTNTRIRGGQHICKKDVSCCVTVSPSPQSKDEENEKLHELQRYARDFRRQHTTDARDFHWDSDDEDYGLAIGRLVVT
jgi:hypothetical protein